MADKKISALTAAATPLAGTEVLPIVQSGSTVKVSVADLTIGRSVQAAGFNFSQAYACEGRNVANTGTAAWFGVAGRVDFGIAGDYAVVGSTTGVLVGNSATNTKWFTIDSNITPAAAAKGVNFTANTPAAGMTSQLLNWYEEGTWTPTFSFTTAGGVSVSYTAQVGKYTRVGRLVTVSFRVAGTITKNSAAGDLIVEGLPFANASNTSDIYSGVCSLSSGFTTVPTAFLQYSTNSSVYVSTGTATIDAAAITSGNAYSVRGTYTFEV